MIVFGFSRPSFRGSTIFSTCPRERGLVVENCGEKDALLDRAMDTPGYLKGETYADGTQKLYSLAWIHFNEWCCKNEKDALPASSKTVAEYAIHLCDSGMRNATIKGRVTAIRFAHRTTGNPIPDTVPVWAAIRGRSESRVRPEANVLSHADLCAIVSACQNTVAGVRNKAFMLLAWDILLKLPDVAALDIEDVKDVGAHGIVLATVKGQRIVTHERAQDGGCTMFCPVCALRLWIKRLNDAGIFSGALFRPVDREGRIANADSDIKYFGRKPEDSRLSNRSIHRILDVVIRDAGIGRCTPRSIRLGGAMHRVAMGESPVDVVARAAWSLQSGHVVLRLMEAQIATLK